MVESVKLAQQTALELARNGINPVLEQGKNIANDSVIEQKDALIATIQTLIWKNEPHKVKKYIDSIFDTIIVDECHNLTAIRYEVAMNHLKASNKELIGFTATAKGEKISKRLKEYFGDSCFEYLLHDAINDGWIVEPRITNHCNLTTVEKSQ